MIKPRYFVVKHDINIICELWITHKTLTKYSQEIHECTLDYDAATYKVQNSIILRIKVGKLEWIE